MPEAVSTQENSDPVYDIAAVCRLTGLSASNLRMWEKRHQAVSPGRTETGRRQYARRDIQRLTLLKALSDKGHSIRTLVDLPLVELESRLEESAVGRPSVPKDQGAPSDDSARTCRMVVIGGHLNGLLDSDDACPPGAQVVCEFDSLAAAEIAETEKVADLLIIEVPALFAEDLNRVRRLLNRFHALRAIIVYAYAQQQTIEAMTDDGGLITGIRAPISLGELRDACAADIALANRSSTAQLNAAPGPREFGEEIPQRRFSQRQLARISKTPSAVDCECPHHLSALLEALNGFEAYSSHCESRNAADAKIHAYLHRMTAHARATMEDALKVLVEFEGIDVGKD
jgi:DNA-binding transcriptional MerR regulator